MGLRLWTLAFSVMLAPCLQAVGDKQPVGNRINPLLDVKIVGRSCAWPSLRLKPKRA